MKNRYFFTLTELLFVLAIIIMLFSLLLPTLQQAKAMGKQVHCMGNMSQIGKGYCLYIDDYNGYLCRYTEWASLLGPYLNQNWKQKTYTGPYKYGTGMDLYFCPVNNSGLTTSGGSYLTNDVICGGYYSLSALKINQIKKVSTVFCQAESIVGTNGYFQWSVWNDTHIFPGSDCRVAWVHASGANVLFVDAHVSKFKQGYITTKMRADY